MNGRLIFRILSALILAAVLVGAGVMVYNSGVARGLAADAQLAAPGQPGQPGENQGQLPYPYYGYGYGPFIRPWGLGCLVPLLGFLVLFGLLRIVFFRGWGGHRHHGWGGPHAAPPPFEEWHRRAHEASAGRPEDAPAE